MDINEICDKLKIVAKVCGGYTSLTTKDGVRIKTYNSSGEEIKELEGKVYCLAREAGSTGSIQVGKSGIDKYSDAWAIPIGSYVVAASNSEKHQRDARLMHSLAEALPYIAKTVGGEAVIFDVNGMRIKSVDASGHESPQYKGLESKAARKTMLNWKPDISPSRSVHYATAVRIPITENFGLGFNNELRAQNMKKLVEEVNKHRTARYDLDDIICVSPQMRNLKELCSFVAQGRSSVMITGETGTGKELFAQSIHNQSKRREKPFVAINCGAIPASLIESYLFGYTEGSFTGAKKQGSIGAFEQANGGTIFLDEISEMDYSLQTKLLRVLQEREVNRIGNFKPTKIDVRVVASSNRNLLSYVQSGKMRNDLYYRLNVVDIEIPPLRDRREDIPVLAAHFAKIITNDSLSVDISPSALDMLTKYHWPGNARELHNCMERALNMLRADENTIEVRHLPVSMVADTIELEEIGENLETVKTLSEYVDIAEKKAIISVLSAVKNNKKKAASILGISVITLWRKIKNLKIEM